MESTHQNFSDLYSFIFYLRDPRTENWLFTHPLSFFGILILYLVFCLYVGPWFMKNKQAYKLGTVISAYNVLQILINLFLFREFWYSLFVDDYNFRCQAVDFSNSEPALRLARTGWWFYISRMMDLCDTVFFVLRKQTNQASFLHIYHHCTMLTSCWINVAFMPGGIAVLIGFVNSFVHVIMYSYYFLTSLGPKYKRYIWWKKYLTQLQIAQFVLLASHSFQALFRDCAYPKIVLILLVCNQLFFINLFGTFYVRSYLRPKPKT